MGAEPCGIIERPQAATPPISPHQPRYVKACHARAWTVTYWRRDGQPLNDKGQRTRHTPFRCQSWRHPGRCRKARAAEDRKRIASALTERDPRGFVYVVLTFDQRRIEQYGGNLFNTYKGLLGCWGKLRKRIIREWGPIEYVAVVEQHRSGWPHVNVLIYNQRLAEECRATEHAQKKNGVYVLEGYKRVRARWLRPHAVASGFGPIAYLEPMHDAHGMAGYLVKLADQLAGEVSKGSQVPVQAPRHFRRLRSSRGFLPPAPTNPDLCGCVTTLPVETVERLGEPFIEKECSEIIEVGNNRVRYIWMEERGSSGYWSSVVDRYKYGYAGRDPTYYIKERRRRLEAERGRVRRWKMEAWSRALRHGSGD